MAAVFGPDHLLGSLRLGLCRNDPADMLLRFVLYRFVYYVNEAIHLSLW